jgi:hypothetical protein
MNNKQCFKGKTLLPIKQEASIFLITYNNKHNDNDKDKDKDKTYANNEYTNNEYSLNQNLFDPSKSSPPNNFLEKLQLRMSIHNSCNKLTNLISE